MATISLPAAISLTEWGERTFFRKFSDGSIPRVTENGRVMIDLKFIMPHLCLPLESDDIAVLEAADAGDPEAQNDLALLFLAKDKPKSAVYWLNLAAKQNFADSMSFLSQCYMEGNGVPTDTNMGIMWLAKAAALGHVIAQTQMDALKR